MFVQLQKRRFDSDYHFQHTYSFFLSFICISSRLMRRCKLTKHSTLCWSVHSVWPLHSSSSSSPVCADCPAPPPVSAGSDASQSALPGLLSRPRCSPSPHSAPSPAAQMTCFNCVTFALLNRYIVGINWRVLWIVPHLLAVPLLCLLLIFLNDSLILRAQFRQNGTQLRSAGRVHLDIHFIPGNARPHLLQFLQGHKY